MDESNLNSEEQQEEESEEVKEVTPEELLDQEPDKIAAILAYVPFLCFYALLLKKENDFAYYHGKQGLVLFIAELIAVALRWNMVWNLLLIVLGATAIWAMVSALRGEAFRIPILSDFVDRYLT
jgi:uncharacterized membrane protein